MIRNKSLVSKIVQMSKELEIELLNPVAVLFLVLGFPVGVRTGIKVPASSVLGGFCYQTIGN